MEGLRPQRLMEEEERSVEAAFPDGQREQALSRPLGSVVLGEPQGLPPLGHRAVCKWWEMTDLWRQVKWARLLTV